MTNSIISTTMIDTMKFLFCKTIPAILLVISCIACNTEETKYAEDMNATMPSDTLLTPSKSNNYYYKRD